MSQAPSTPLTPGHGQALASDVKGLGASGAGNGSVLKLRSQNIHGNAADVGRNPNRYLNGIVVQDVRKIYDYQRESLAAGQLQSNFRCQVFEAEHLLFSKHESTSSSVLTLSMSTNAELVGLRVRRVDWGRRTSPLPESQPSCPWAQTNAVKSVKSVKSDAPTKLTCD